MEGVKRQTSFSIEKETYNRIQEIKKYFMKSENIKLTNSAVVDKAIFELANKYNDEIKDETHK